jgi:hypothetical protein
MSDTPSYEANNVDELKAEIDRRGISRSGLSHKDELIKVLNKDDKASGKSAKSDTPDELGVPTETAPESASTDALGTGDPGNPEEFTGDEAVKVERSDTQGVALGEIPLLDPRATVGAAPRIPEGFESAAASARGARAEALVVELGQHGIDDVQAALDAHPAGQGEFLVEASGPVAVTVPDDSNDEGDDV